jgi:hypothetical protein
MAGNTAVLDKQRSKAGRKGAEATNAKRSQGGGGGAKAKGKSQGGANGAAAKQQQGATAAQRMQDAAGQQSMAWTTADINQFFDLMGAYQKATELIESQGQGWKGGQVSGVTRGGLVTKDANGQYVGTTLYRKFHEKFQRIQGQAGGGNT